MFHIWVQHSDQFCAFLIKLFFKWKEKKKQKKDAIMHIDVHVFTAHSGCILRIKDLISSPDALLQHFKLYL